MDFITQLIMKTALQVWTTFLHNWPFLLVSILIAVALKLYTNPEKISAFLTRYRRAGVVGATAAAVTTPLCSCGTTAIILGMMASTIPWAPIIAFMVASPLTSPEELIYSAGLFGWPFAIAFFVSSIILGLVGGLVGEILEQRGWLVNQARFSDASRSRAPEHNPTAEPAAATATFAAAPSCGCGTAPAPAVYPARPSVIRASHASPFEAVLQVAPSQAGEAVMSLPTSCACSGERIQSVPETCACTPAVPACGCVEDKVERVERAVTWRLFLSEALITGRRLLVMFLGFAFIGYFLNGLIPSAWVSTIFGAGNIYSVPLSATLGLPLYINTEASLPLIRALIDGGMSQGAALAFLITGAGTSIGAIAGAFTIARWRVIITVVGTLWVGAIAMGYLYDFLLISGLL